MSNATVRLLEEIAQGARAGDAAVRAQVALIRSLIDEIDRRVGPAGHELDDQVEEEMARLRRMRGAAGIGSA